MGRCPLLKASKSDKPQGRRPSTFCSSRGYTRVCTMASLNVTRLGTFAEDKRTTSSTRWILCEWGGPSLGSVSRVPTSCELSVSDELEAVGSKRSFPRPRDEGLCPRCSGHLRWPKASIPGGGSRGRRGVDRRWRHRRFGWLRTRGERFVVSGARHGNGRATPGASV